MKVLMKPGDYFGVKSQTRVVNNIILSETRYQGKQKIPDHYHSNFYICYVVQGAFAEWDQNKNTVCNSGDIIIHPAFQEHSNEFHAETGTCFNIEIANNGDSGVMTPNDGARILPDPIIAACIKKAYSEFKLNDPFSEKIIEGLIMETLGYLQRRSFSSAPYWLKKAKELIHDRKEGISIAYLSNELDISPSHLCREFKKGLGLSIGEYIQNLRISEACRMLKVPTASLLKIALDTGFADQSHFTRAFKKVMGVTPARYRAMIR